MKDYNEEYFLLNGVGAQFPDLEFDGPMSIENTFKLWKREAIDNSVIPLRIGDPVPRNPQMADIFNLRSNIAISERMKLLFEDLGLKNVQYIPATIFVKNVVHENYFILHNYNMVRCADMEKSVYIDRNKKNAVRRVYDFNKLVLDNEALDKIPLDERLVVYVEESNFSRIYHRSIVKKILELKPKGAAFYQLSTYDPRKPFHTELLDQILSDKE